MKKIFSLLLCLMSVSSYAQEKFNLDFEEIQDGKPVNWENRGSDVYSTFIDTLNSYSGKNSAVIEYDGDLSDFKMWRYTIPAKYSGDKIKLTGYIKTQNVTDGWAGLWFRITPGWANSMEDRGIKGTTDWEKYEIELKLNPDQDQDIILGGILLGKGKMWIDNLKLTIDGVALEDAKLKEVLPAERDTAFDNGSDVVFPKLDERLTGDLELLGKIWGLLKYHHPEIGKGNYNWDYELFRMLPSFLKQENSTERDQFLLDWIEKYGAVPPCDSCRDTAEDAFLKPDHNWITSSNISQDLKDKLHYIRKNRHQGKQFYIGKVSGVGNPQFNHEDSYMDMPYPDEGFRLLTVYKYWNMIHYFFPYKHLMDQEWNDQMIKKYKSVLFGKSRRLTKNWYYMNKPN